MSILRSQHPYRRAVIGDRCRCAVLVTLLGWPTAAQTPDPLPQVSEVERVSLVLLPTTVTTRRGEPVRDLGPEDFRLFEEGVEQRIDLFATEESSPIALAFLLDVSGSMGLGGRLELAKEAIRRFLEALDGDDRVGLIRFADERVEWAAGFDDDRRTFLERLAAQRPLGRTALYDALAASPGLVDQETPGRKAIVLITDGVDNASEMPRLRATWMARRIGVPIYTLGFIPMREKLLASRARKALGVVERFSRETGGALFAIHRPPDLDRAVGRIQEELRFQYVIGFYRTDGLGNGSFRRLKLTTIRDRLRVRTRSGYYADP